MIELILAVLLLIAWVVYEFRRDRGIKMNDHIPGTPLKSLTWNNETGVVKIEFRDGTDFDEKEEFLYDLIEAVEDTIGDLHANGI